jgi:drug/metabolite transporter (DMT)-like permease
VRPAMHLGFSGIETQRPGPLSRPLRSALAWAAKRGGLLTPLVLAVVLVAAVLHASWNAMLRSGVDRLWTMTAMCTVVALVCALSLPFVPRPFGPSWPYVVLSGVLHVGYCLFLVLAYRTGDFVQSYPVARGSSPLLVTLGAAVFAGERLNLGTSAAILLVAGGIMALAFESKRFRTTSVPAALGTGCFIGAYSVTDGLGVRLSGSAVGYTVWMCLIWGVGMPLLYVALRDVRSLRRPRADNVQAALAGLLSLAAYGLILWAMQRAPLGPVSALRETSVVFAALIGWLLLRQPLSARRAFACTVIAVGAAWLGYASAPVPKEAHSAAASMQERGVGVRTYPGPGGA